MSSSFFAAKVEIIRYSSFKNPSLFLKIILGNKGFNFAVSKI